MLLLEGEWVNRRVETLDVLSTQAVRRWVSVDFTVPHLFRDLLKVGDDGWVVPLATLQKKPLRHFDLRDEAGRAVPLVGREHNGAIAHAALVAVAHRALSVRGRTAPSERLRNDLAAVARQPREEALATIDCIERAAPENEECRLMLEDDAASFLLYDLAVNYILLAVTTDVEHRRVLKFGSDDSLELRRELAPRPLLGWTPQIVRVAVPAVGRTASWHGEVVIPEELRVDAAFVYDEDSREVFDLDLETDRASLYASRVALGARTVVVFGVRPERAGFPVQAFAVAAVTAGLLWLGALSGTLDSKQAGPPIALLLAGSALFAGAIAQAGEHRLVRSLFVWPRLLLLGAGLSGLVSAAFLAFSLPPGTVKLTWMICAIAASVAAILLLITLGRARPITPPPSAGHN